MTEKRRQDNLVAFACRCRSCKARWLLFGGGRHLHACPFCGSDKTQTRSPA